jgi:catechol 2,3-dioxygenase-like lactoylglutathione lyase family enzyme
MMLPDTPPIDHLVLPVRDLDRAAEAYQALGFTVTARGVHPWGTHNRLVQFENDTFLELLTVGEPAKIAEPAPGEVSFGAFNRDFLASSGEGVSMLVLASGAPAADRAAFREAGLPTQAPFDFRRIARAPDGTEREVAFTLTFTSDAGLPGAGFFTCAQHFPENFWRADLRRHANDARGVSRVVMVADDPADHHVFLKGFTRSADVRMTSAGLTLALGRGGALDVLSPLAFERRHGVAMEGAPARFRAYEVAGLDPERLRAAGGWRCAAGVALEVHGAILVASAT